MSPPTNVTLVLGIPIDDITAEQAVQRTLELADECRKDGRPRHIVTVNVDFLTNALGWTPWSAPRHPELLDILRRADLVTADGMPVVWLAKLLGTPLKGRVTGADLTPALTAAMARTGHRLYLLGGRGDIAHQAADKLTEMNPELQIAGIYSPFVHTEGEAMLDSEEEDADTVTRINSTEPDVLLIAFGNPKQEIWFHRNRHQLRAGVSIGIGGTFEFIVGRVSRAPAWMQRTGLEWIYRISQDPKRLWKRYAIGLMKLMVMSIPLVIHYRIQHWRFGRQAAHSSTPIHAPANQGDAVSRLILPEVADAAWAQTQAANPAWKEARDLVVDFSAARFLDSSALGYLARIWKSRQNARRPVRAEGLEQTGVGGLLRMTRTWDLFADKTDTPSSANAASSQLRDTGLFQLSESLDGIRIARLSGRLDADRVTGLNADVLNTELGTHDLVLDLTDLHFIDSTGLGFIFRLQRLCNEQGQRLLLCGMQPPVRQLMDITRLTALFEFTQTLQQALKRMGKLREEAET